MVTRFVASRRPELVIAGLAVTLLAGALPGLDAMLERLLTVSGVLTTLLGVWSGPALDRVGRIAAAAEFESAQRTSRQLLGDAAHPGLADIRFRRPREDTEPELVGWRDDKGASTGSVGEVLQYFCQLRHHRMVVLGTAGAGKTVALVRLVHDLNRALLAGTVDLDLPHQARAAVLLDLHGWTTGARWPTLAAASTQELVNDLDAWIARQIAVRHGISVVDARRVVSEGAIIPVLDGLDEMDAPLSSRPRAAAMIRLLNGRSGPVVLACRLEAYRALAAEKVAAGEAPILQDAQSVILEALDSDAVVEYLTDRFSNGGSGIHPSWRPVVEAIRAGRTDLAKVLGQPLRLFQAATAYSDAGSAELTRIPAARLPDHMMARHLAVVPTFFPRPGRRRRRYDPDRMVEWLTTFACLLRVVGDPEGPWRWSGSDIHLDDLWMVPGRYLARGLSFSVKMVLLAAPFVAIIVVGASRHVLTLPPLALLLASLVLGGLLLGWGDLSPHPKPLSRNDLRVSHRRPRIFDQHMGGLAGGLVFGLLCAAGSGLFVGLVAGVSQGVVGGSVIGIVGGVVIGIIVRCAGVRTIDRPSRLFRKSLLSDAAVIYSITMVLALGPAVWLAWWSGAALGSAVVMTGMAALSGIAVGSWVFLLASRWPRYWIAVAIAARRGLLPPRPAAFLDWAYTAGLFRISGIAVQFRHHELQEWLAARRLGLDRVPGDAEGSTRSRCRAGGEEVCL